MNTYLRLIRFNGSLAAFLTPFTVFSVLHTVFGVLNITILIPLFDVLFDTAIDLPALAYTQHIDSFRWDSQYAKDALYYHFGEFIQDYGKQYALYLVCGVALAASLLSNFFRYLSIRILEQAKARAIHNMRVSIFNKMTMLHIGYFTTRHKGDIMSRSTNDLQEIEFSITTALGAFLREPINILVYFISLFAMSVELTIFTLVVIPLSGALISGLVKRLKEDSKKTQHALGIILSIIDEMINGIRVIKAFNAENYLKSKFAKESASYSTYYKSLSYKREAASPVSELMGVCVVVVILLYGGNMVLSEQSTLAASVFTVYILLFSRVMIPVKSLFAAISAVQKTIVSGKRIFEILDEQPAIRDSKSAVEFKEFSTSVAFENISFSYEQKQVLKKINFEIPLGKSIALVGPSGGGKSTIADLLPRFYDVHEGSIQIGNKDIRAYTLSSLREQMGIVTQESILFNDTIFNNIAFGNPDANLEEVIRASKVANAHAFIIGTEHAYETVIGDRGLKLSGGQRQRISIARAIFKNPPILILDEATSSLDTESEKLVQQALQNLMKNRTSLVIAHRLSTIQHAHEILVIDKGQIVERGTHNELVSQRGIYYKLQRMQSIS